ncbi:TonB-dependent receptor [Methylobacillus arboreus]|uniref:TonB-dependent receptor n=1 Tax=Methylobacillus arboreus TaxID=755170 RepID=UPI001E2E42C2|nr:TonB-dependent receptor [Methylobacillus arboreus]MCB5190160.1 TonB-dependent receptor [Methylobacillus arboreus]
MQNPHTAPVPKRILIAIAMAFGSPLATQAVQAEEQIELPTIAVTANPLGVASDELVVPVSTLSGRELSLQRESTLGETLKSIPGISSTYFGPNASRPVIHGLDGERVRMMQNGVGILDASSLSFDHAVALDPLVIEQIDVVRGPAALLYGGSAVGGVVNAIDHRIPKEAIDGVTGRSEIRFGGAENQKNGAIVLDAGNGVLTVHADAYKRKTDDLDIPGYAVSRRKNEADGEARENKGRLVNSGSDADGGAIGASIALENGYVGMSYSTFNNKYGTVADPDVLIDMKSDRWDFASELRDLGSIINKVKVRMAHTDYEHRELEDGEVGTTFKNRGLEGSIEASHGNIGPLSGVIGLQFHNSRFEALGEEAFVPPNRTNTRALYVYEELPLDALKLTFGGRVEHAKIESSGGGDFGPSQSRSFTPYSLATGALFNLNEQWSLAANLSHNERAPSYFELYADGEHVATGQYEVGSTDLQKERSNGIDAQLRWKQNHDSFSIGAYYTRFSNFIGLFNSGILVNEEGEAGEVDSDIPEARFTGAKAVFKGLEAEGKFRVYDKVGALDLKLRGDYVRATNRDTGDSLPRISPLKLGFGLDYRFNRFGSRLDVLRAFKQNRTDDNELATDGYTLVNATLTYKLPTPSYFQLEAFAKAYNLLDQTIRDHTSLLKDIAPMGGRSLLVGLRGEF